MAANDAVSMNVAENRQNVPMAIQENRAAVPMVVAEGSGTPGGLNRKADKVTGAVAGNLAGLDANGNLTDSGKAPEDFLEAPAAAGSAGQVLTADGEGSASWQDPTGGDPTEIIDDTAGSGDTDKVWSADKSADEAQSLMTEINSKYEKPNTGIPATDMAEAVQTSIGKADTAYQKPVGGIPLTDLADNTESVTGTTPSITGVAGHRYICGECATLSITAPASGCIDVVFESGSTATVLTVTSAKTGVSAIKWANGFDPSALDTNTTYEINILDGEFGVVGSWT